MPITPVPGRASLLAALAALVAFPVAAIDFAVSGFGTVGYARSDQPYTYQRFIDDEGTFKRDSLAGLQLDAQHEKFGATVQFKYAPSDGSDGPYKGTVSWAFLSWRPDNDWLLRAGKQRIPLYLYSQTVDVGVTYDFARLPPEMYSLSPANDFNGVSLYKTWGRESGEISLEGYGGKFKGFNRFWIRDGVPAMGPGVQNVPPGAQFVELDIKGGGLALSYKRNDDTYRLSGIRANFQRSDSVPIPTTYPFVTLFPGVGYYRVPFPDGTPFPGPDVPSTKSVNLSVVTLGADVGLGSGFRVLGEVARTFVPHTDISFASTRGYASLLKQIDHWTPYVTYAFLRSQPAPRNLYNNVNYNTVPDIVPGSAAINASQRFGADFLIAYDQHSWSLGTAYSLSASQKLKVEYTRSRIGQMSSLVDPPPFGNVRNQNINVFSLSYNFAF